jgi:hypothetical protein
LIYSNGKQLFCKCGKRCYSEKEAGYHINLKNKRSRCRKSGTGNIPKRKYYCSECGYWHLTCNKVRHKKTKEKYEKFLNEFNKKKQ